MTEPLLDRVQRLLNEEIWTSTAISDFTVNRFEAVDALIKEIYEENAVAEIKEICEERLASNKNSVLALYLVGLISWQDQQLEDADLIELITMFYGKGRMHIVEFLCLKMLKSGESRAALSYLAEYYQQSGQVEERLSILERLMRADYDNPLIAIELAQKSEEGGNLELATNYYKKAVFRYINRKQFTGVYEVWLKLLNLIPDAEDLFGSIVLKVEKTFDPERSIDLQKGLYQHLKVRGRWEPAIAILKKLLSINPKDAQSRKELVECYRAKYKNHSRLEDALKISNLGQNWRPAIEAIESFERHISLDKGRFVFHRVWGVGRVKSVTEDQVTIDFAKKRGHSMSLDMAITSLLGLNSDHIWVLKMTLPKEALRTKIKQDIPWALTIMAAGSGGRTDMKKVKAELTPSLLTASEWSSWSTEARRTIRTNASFGNDASKADVYTLRLSPVTYEEKQVNRFKGEENFFKKLVLFEEFLLDSEPDNEYIGEMYNFFYSYLKADRVSEQVVVSYLLVQNLAKLGVAVNTATNSTFLELYNDIPEIESLFDRIDSAKYRKEFLLQVKKYVDNWQEIYLLLLPQHPANFMVEDLDRVSRHDDVIGAFNSILERYRGAPEAFFWLMTFLDEVNGYEYYAVKIERILLALFHLMGITARGIAAKKDLPQNKRINRMAMTALFKDGKLSSYILVGSEEMVLRLYSLAQEIKELDTNLLSTLKMNIWQKFPNVDLDAIKGQVAVPRSDAQIIKRTSEVLWVTEKAYTLKNLRMKELVEVEIPKNSLEIGEAIKKGDLKENAEYIAGKEMQDQLQLEVGRLQKELDAARLFEMSQIDTSMVGFGVIVTLQPVEGKRKEIFTILGPWESNPDKKIISYQAPFAEALMGKKFGDVVEFTINERHYKYEIEEITAAKF